MKNIIFRLSLILVMSVLFVGCEKNTTVESSNTNNLSADAGAIDDFEAARTSDVDVDLTKLSSTMVYSEVYNMMYTPDDYIGKTVRMSGQFVAYSSQDGSTYYPSVIIADATACCAQGLEFILKGDPQYPEGYPSPEKDITVTGVFETYQEGEGYYCRLKDAQLE